MKIKAKMECAFDVAIKLGQREYMASVDFTKWVLYKKRIDESGYNSIKFLCFTVASLNRDVFDKWLETSLLGLLGEQPTKSSPRQDLF